ncbi:hypothetical protein F5Y01DRAFT_311149 [Xylaria sp. FL0043]|nr:hypothetical protein F5Y01DRAFT_311149 [Xylaria sp. FL0043]
MKPSEEKIPVHHQAQEVYFVVDCPSLHIVQLGRLGPRRQSTSSTGLCDFEPSSLCPAYGQLTTKARQIPSICFAPTGSPTASDITLTPPLPLERFDPPWQAVSNQQCPSSYKHVSIETASQDSSQSLNASSLIRTLLSPTLPEPITSLNIIDNHLEESRFTNSSRPSTASPEQKRNALFNIKWPGLKAKSNCNKGQPRSTYSQESNDAGFPKFMLFTFALTGGALLWLSLLVVHCSGLPERSSVYPLDDHTEPRCLAISANNAFVAVGFGTKVLLLYYQGAEQQWLRVLRILELTNPSMARFQVMNISGDSSCLVVSTQKRDAMRSEDDDVVFTHVWRCEPGSNSPLTLWPCRMPTDGQGSTTINFHPVPATGLITGLTTTPYPLFLHARAPPSGHQIYLLDQRSRVLCADLQAQSIHVIADLNALRGALKPQEEQAVIGVSMAGRPRVLWRQGDGLHIVKIETGEGMGVGTYYNKKNISWRWFDALGVS